MVREDSYMTVPSLFRCPISLDVMESPVSLCTGVTYDRSSIQRWLDAGNNTCPATMQVLQSKEFVPNYTLQRLIRIWSDTARARTRRETTHPLSKDQAQDIIRRMKVKHRGDERNGIWLENISKLILFAKESDENRLFLVSSAGFSALLVEILGNPSENIGLREKIIHLLSLILEENKDKEWASKLFAERDCFQSMLLLLRRGSTESRVATARILELISIDVGFKYRVAEHNDLLMELLNLVKSGSDPNAIEAGLSCLISISMPRKIREKLIHTGAVKEIGKLLTDLEVSVSISEKGLKLLEMLSACREGRTEICDDKNCVPAILNRMLKVSGVATELAVTILWSLCCLFRDWKAQDAVAKGDGLARVLLLMQTNCSPVVRQMCRDLLKIFRANYKCCLSSYHTKTTHIMPF